MPNEIIEIRLDQILLNDANPRGFTDPTVVEAIAASMAVDSQKTEIKVRLLDNAQYRVVGGDHRVLAARKLGWTTIRAEVLNITPDQVFLEAYLDNQGKPMGWFADYMAIEALWNRTDRSKGSQKAVADRLMKSEAQVSTALKLMPLLNAGSRQLILQALKNGGKLPVTQNGILALTGLATGQPDDQTRVEATLRVLLDQKMNDPHAKGLIAWVKVGNPPETYTAHKAASPPKPKAPKLTVQDLAKAAELGKLAGAEETRGDAATTHRDALKAFMDSATVANPTPTPNTPEPNLKPINRTEGLAIFGQQIAKGVQWLSTLGPSKKTESANGNIHGPLAQPSHAPRFVASAQVAIEKKTLKLTEKVVEGFKKIVWHWMMKGVHHVCRKVAQFVVPIKQFGSSNQRHSGTNFSLSTLAAMILHWFVYTLCLFTFWWFVVMKIASLINPALRPWFERSFRFIAHEMFAIVFAWVWPGMLHDWVVALVVALAVFGIYNAAKAQPQRMAFLGLVIAGLWFFGRGWSSAPPSSPGVTGISSPVGTQVTPVITANNENKKPSPKKTTKISSSPVKPFVEDTETQTNFEDQLKVIPLHSLIMAYTFQPDFNMGSDMAYHRLMDLQLREKYTVLFGKDKETVTNIYSGASNLTLTMQGGLSRFLGDAAKENIYWENIKAFYCDVIKSGTGINAKTTYEIFLVLEDSKKPLAIQCATGADLEHLVSALEYYIKNSGHSPAPIGSLPYLNQGLLMDNDREVTLLWADSPAGKTALTFGDILWSVEKNRDKQQTKTELETALQSFSTNGHHNEPLVQPNRGSRLVASTQVSGPHNLYFVKPDEMTRALKESADNPDTFYPTRKKVILTIP